MQPVPEQLSRTIDTLYRAESGRVLATLVRLLGDLDLAEEAMHEAFAAAIEQWQHHGLPANPRAWLVSTGRFKAIDALRRRAHSDNLREAVTRRVNELASVNANRAAHDIEDDPVIAHQIGFWVYLPELVEILTISP